MSNKFFNWKEIWKIIKERMFVCAEIIEESKDKIKILIELGKIKDMHKDKVTLSQLANMIQKVNDNLEAFKQDTISRLDRLEKDVALIKSCPTIKKEIAELNSSK